MAYMTWLLFVAPPVGVGSLVFLYRYRWPACDVRMSLRATPGHASSLPMTVMNPRQCAVGQDSYTLRIPTRLLRPELSDEEIVARFSKGFFGGWVLWPEKWLFRATGLRLTEVPAWNKLAPPLERISDPAHLSASALPRLGSILCDNFFLLDSSAASQQEREALFPAAAAAVPRPGFAFAEFVAGSEQIGFVSDHRFEVTREGGGPDGNVRITFSHVRCNPTGGGLAFIESMRQFHFLYSRLLFADGVREVMKP